MSLLRMLNEAYAHRSDNGEIEQYASHTGGWVTIGGGPGKKGESPSERENYARQRGRRLVSMFRDVERIYYRLTNVQWREEQHPRNKDGQFAGTDSGKHAATRVEMATAKRTGENWTRVNGGELPEAVAKLRIPPAWTDVKVATAEGADVLAMGFDAKGRRQTIYSDSWAMQQAAQKFAKISELQRKASAIKVQMESDWHGGNDNAMVAALIFATGIRPGSETNTRAKTQAYGATTLKVEHVKVDQNGVRLEFTGKKGVSLSIPVQEEDLARELRKRAAAAKPDARLFPGVSAQSLRDYVRTLDGGGYRPKDFRTRLGSAVAASEVAKVAEIPKSEKQYKKVVRGIAKSVSAVLGNTPTVAIKSYIDPVVFSKLRPA